MRSEQSITLTFKDRIAVVNVIRTLQTEVDVRNQLQGQRFKNSTESTIRDLQETIHQLKTGIGLKEVL